MPGYLVLGTGSGYIRLLSGKSEAGGVSFSEDTARIRKKVATLKSGERQ
jgi:hypothetical protein